MTENPIYRILVRPIQTRKDILSSALKSAELLKNYEDLSALKEEKQEKIKKFNLLQRSINNQLSTLRRQLPVINLPKEHTIRVKEFEVKAKPETEKIQKPSTTSKLERELNEIREKLNYL